MTSDGQKVVAVLGLTELTPTGDGDFEGILQEVMADKPHKRKNKMLVEFHVVPTCSNIHLTRVQTQELLCDHPVDTIKFFCSSPRDKRLFFYAVSLPGSRKTLCICLRTLKNDKAVTGNTVCKALEYAQWFQRSTDQFVHTSEAMEADRILSTSQSTAHETAGNSGSPDTPHIYEETDVVSAVPHKELEEAETSHGSKEFVTGIPELTDVGQVYKEPLPRSAQDEEDNKQIISTGLVFRMKILAILTKQAPIRDYDGILQNVMADKPHKRKNKILVDFCVSPTRVLIMRVESGKLFSENHMDVVKFFCSPPQDKRVFFYAMGIPNACKTHCFYLRTLRNDRTVTGERVCKALKFAQWYWMLGLQLAMEQSLVSVNSDYSQSSSVSAESIPYPEDCTTDQELASKDQETAKSCSELMYESDNFSDDFNLSQLFATDGDRAEVAVSLATTPYELSMNETTSVEHEPLIRAHPSNEFMMAGNVSTELGVSTDNDSWSSSVSVQDEEDMKQITSTGLVFRMKVLTVLYEQAPIYDYGSILQEVMADISQKRISRMLVDFCVDLTGVHMTRVETGELLVQFNIDVLELFCSFPLDKRMFFYAIPSPDGSKTLCICLHTLKNDRTVTGERVCKALKFCQWNWLSRHHLRSPVCNNSSVSTESAPYSEDYTKDECYPTDEELASKYQETVKLVYNDNAFSNDAHLIFTTEDMELNINMSQLTRANSKLMFTSLHFGMLELSNIVTMLGGSPLPPLKSEDYNLSFTDILYPNTSLRTTVLATYGDRAEVKVSLATTPYELSTNETTSVERKPLIQAHPYNNLMMAGGVSTELGVSTEPNVSPDNDTWRSSVSTESVPYSRADEDYTTGSMAGEGDTTELATDNITNPEAQYEEDKKQIASTGLVFRMKVLAVRTEQAPVCEFKGILQSMMVDKPHKKMLVDFCVSPTGVLIKRVDTGELLAENPMKTIKFYCSFPQDKRVFFYVTSIPNASKIQCICFHTDRTVTGVRVCRALLFALKHRVNQLLSKIAQRSPVTVDSIDSLISSVSAESIPCSEDYAADEEQDSEDEEMEKIYSKNSLSSSVSAESIPCSEDYAADEEQDSEDEEVAKIYSKQLVTDTTDQEVASKDQETVKSCSELVHESDDDDDFNLSQLFATDGDRAEVAVSLATTPYELSMNETASVEHEPLIQAHPSNDSMTTGGVSSELSVSTELSDSTENDSRSSSVSAESMPYSETDEDYTTDSTTGGSDTTELAIANPHVEDKVDKKQIMSTGLTFRMAVLAVLTKQAPIRDYDDILQNVMAEKLHKRKNKILVDFCVSPTGVLIMRVESGELLCENHMEVVEFFCSPPQDKRVFFYAISLPISGKILCFCLRTLRTVTGERVCKAVKFAQWHWEFKLHLQSLISVNSDHSQSSSVSAESIPYPEDCTTDQELASKDQETVKSCSELVYESDDDDDFNLSQLSATDGDRAEVAVSLATTPYELSMNETTSVEHEPLIQAHPSNGFIKAESVQGVSNEEGVFTDLAAVGNNTSNKLITSDIALAENIPAEATMASVSIEDITEPMVEDSSVEQKTGEDATTEFSTTRLAEGSLVEVRDACTELMVEEEDSSDPEVTNSTSAGLPVAGNTSCDLMMLGNVQVFATMMPSATLDMASGTVRAQCQELETESFSGQEAKKMEPNKAEDTTSFKLTIGSTELTVGEDELKVSASTSAVLADKSVCTLSKDVSAVFMRAETGSLPRAEEISAVAARNIAVCDVIQTVSGVQFQERESKDLGDSCSSHSHCSGVPQAEKLSQDLSHAQTLISNSTNTLSAEQQLQEAGFLSKAPSQGILRCSSV